MAETPYNKKKIKWLQQVLKDGSIEWRPEYEVSPFKPPPSEIIVANISSSGTSSYAGFALSSSYAFNATSASYSFNATSASYAFQATSASYSTQALSASYAVSASVEIIKEVSSSHANFADTASLAYNALTASYVNPLNQDVFINGDLYVTGSLSSSGSITHTGSINLLSSSISVVDYIDFNNTGIPTPPDIEGRIYWDEDNGTLSLGMHGGQVVQQVGLEEYFYIKNQTGDTIPNGSVVRAAGTLGASGRILGDLMIADGSVTYYFTLGIATEDIVDGDDGYVTQFGAVRGIDTTGTAVSESWNDGDVLWVSPTVLGGLTKFEPDSPNLKIQMAIVINAASNGTLFVRPDLSGFLTDLHNVNDFTTTASFGDLLVKSGSTWINTKQLTGSYGLTGSIEGGSFTGSFSGSFNGTLGPISNTTYRLTSSFYTASVSDYRIGVRYTQTGSVSIQLPLITNAGEIEYRFKDEEGNADTNNITLVASGSNLIDGDTTAILDRNYIAISLYNDGISNWYIE